MKEFREKCIEKLDEWMKGVDYLRITVKETVDAIIFITVSAGYTPDERTIEIYRVFKVGDGLEISKDLEQVINFKHDVSILGAIKEIIEVYETVK